MKVNLIISTYGASYTRINKKYYLRKILALLNKTKTNVAQITIMKPRINPEHTEFTDYYNLDTIDISNIKSRIKIFECENIGLSYGQFLTGISLNPDFDYSIFIEDDYFFFIDYFEDYLVNHYGSPDTNSFLCLFYFESRTYNMYESINNVEHMKIKNEFVTKMKKYNFDIDSRFKVPDFSCGIMSKQSYEKIINTFGSINNINDILSIKFNNYWIYQIFFGYILHLSNIKINGLHNNTLNLFYHTDNDKISMCNFDINSVEWDKYPYNNEKFNIPLMAPIEFLYPYNQKDLINKLLIYLKDPDNLNERYNFLNEEMKQIDKEMKQLDETNR